MTHWKPAHAPLHAALACALHDPRFKGRYVTWDVARTICDGISPDGFTTKQFSVTNSFKGVDDDVPFDIYNKVDATARKDLECEAGTVMRVMKNIRLGKNTTVHYVGCFGPDDTVPKKSDVIQDVDLI